MEATSAAPKRRTTSLAKAGMKTYEGVRGGVYRHVQTLPQFEAFLEVAMEQPELAVDTETSGLDWVHKHACGISIGWGVGNNFYIPFAHQTTERQLALEDILDGLRRLLGRTDTTKIFWNSKFDLHVLRKCGIEVGGLIHDPLHVAWILDENSSHALKDLSLIYVDPTADKWETMVDEWRTMEARRRQAEYRTRLKTVSLELENDDATLNEVEQLVRAENVDQTTTDSKTKLKMLRTILKRFAVDRIAHELCAQNKKDDVSYDYIPLEIMIPYACADVHYAWLLHKEFILTLVKTPSLVPLYSNEVRLTRALFEMEDDGVKIDRDYLVQIGPKFDADAEAVAKEIYAAVGYPFNISSDAQLTQALEKVGVQLTKKTKKTKELERAGIEHTPKFSVDKDVLDTIATEHPFAALVLRYRSLCKLKGTYVDGILERLDDKDFVHTNYSQNVSTGRMSAAQPNLNNIPARDKTIRKAFIVPDSLSSLMEDGHSSEWLFVFVDYSQVELRLTADRSGDPTLISCYPFEGKGKDVHTLTLADVVLNQPLDVVQAMAEDKTGHMKEPPRGEVCKCPSCAYDFYRNISKRVNFGIIYGAEAPTIQRQVSTPTRPVSKEQCEEYIDRYFQKYQGVHAWIKDTHKFIQHYGWVRNTFGRYRRIDVSKIPRREHWKVERACRQGVNYLIQGEAADLFKTSVVRVHELLRKEKARTRLVNVVHDEIQFYWHRDELSLLGPVKKAMEDYQYKVPIVAEFSVSETDWASKKGIKL